MPGLEMGAHPRPVRRGLFGADARQMMACRRVAGAVIGAACRSDPAVQAAHRRRHWTFVTRAGHRERGAEGQRKLQILGKTLPPAARSGFGLAVADHVDAVGIAGGQVGKLDAVRLGRRSSVVRAAAQSRRSSAA